MRPYYLPEPTLLILVVTLLLTGCSLPESGIFAEPQASQAANLVETQTFSSAQESPVARPDVPQNPTESISPTFPAPDTGWQVLRPGLERRLVTAQREGAGIPERFYMLRIDPDYFRFDIGYHPGEPQLLGDWMTETGALIVVNGGYFTESWEATGAIIIGGQQYGTSYQGFGGMLEITENNPGLRWLPQRPFDFQEPLQAGLQSFPMLVTPGNQIGFPEEDDIPARRTVIAQDRQGRFLFVLASSGTFTLHQLSRYLVASDLDLEMALNLDGGSSTGLMLADPVEGILPFTQLPAVITVHPK